LAPTLGGLLVGLFIHHLMPGRHPQGVAEVIEAMALRSGRMDVRTGIFAAISSSLSLGSGASVGQEGPAVHLGATFGGWLAHRLHLTRALSRTLLGCGVAAAVAASFNAPIAGALFASEVVIANYSLSAFAPIVIASVTGTAVSRAYFGASPAFVLPLQEIVSFWEFPAFVGLGLAAGLTAIIFQRMIGVTDQLSRRLPAPDWMRPAIGGLLVGLIAVFYPQVLGVGYGTTESALTASFPFVLLLAILVAKVAATVISLGFGFGGGIFSPALVIGALLGGAYGVVATQIFPELSSGHGAYTVVGMGSIAAGVLGAPISTTLIIFELTGNYPLTMAVMTAVVIASVITQQFHATSYFAWQLERRGLDLRGEFEAALLRAITVRQVMARDGDRVTPDTSLPLIRTRLQHCRDGELFVVREGGELHGTITLNDLSDQAFTHDLDELVNAGDLARRHPPVLSESDTLENALKIIQGSGEQHIAVVDSATTMNFIGCIHERDVMRAYNRALVESRREVAGH
jgi:CIC family chloride channel protein